MAYFAPSRLYHTDQVKIGFDGNKRNVYESWQFVTSFVDENNIFLIESGWKYVHEKACHPRRSKKAKYVSFLEGNYYAQRTHHISLMDWQEGIVKCVNEKLSEIRYEWYGEKSVMQCFPQKNNRYTIIIHAGLHIYRFVIRVEKFNSTP
jgi:hypothetical protein